MANLHHALLFTATLQEQLLCIRNLAKSYRNEFHESQDVTARDSANCRCDCNNAVSSHEQPWWACCDRVERLQRFREITNSDRGGDRNRTSDLRTQSRYTFANCKSNRHVLPRMRPRSSQKATALCFLPQIAKSDCDESPVNCKVIAFLREQVWWFGSGVYCLGGISWCSRWKVVVALVESATAGMNGRDWGDSHGFVRCHVSADATIHQN